MATTTAAAIRDVMRSTVRALTPPGLVNVPYQAHDERVEFRRWAEQTKGGAFRWFSIRDMGAIEPPVVSNADVEWVVTRFVCQVAYPRDYRYGGQLAMDMDDVIELDLRKIEHAIGTNGYSAIESAVGNATVTTDGTARDEEDACVFGVLTLTVRYWRAMP